MTSSEIVEGWWRYQLFKSVEPNEHATVYITVYLMDNNSIIGCDVITTIQKVLTVYDPDDKLPISHW